MMNTYKIDAHWLRQRCDVLLLAIRKIQCRVKASIGGNMKDWVNTFYERTQAARSLGCALIHDLAPVNDDHDVDGEQRFQCKAHNCDFRAVQTTKDRLQCYDRVNHRL